MIKEILITSLTGRGSVVMKDRAYKGGRYRAPIKPTASRTRWGKA